MNTIHILDCTLRDGGYCNEWRFGLDNIKRIISGLVEANVEIIECGFLTNKYEYKSNTTLFNSVEEIASVIPENRQGKIFVAMVNYGEYDVDRLPARNSSSIDGLRVAFHKKNRHAALEFCKRVREKGYLVFVQAMVSLSYTDDEFLDTIRCVNDINPYSFYIVDSFGMMKEKDLTRLFYMIEHNLNPDIWIGFHSHNNMQLAYSNAQKLTMVQTNRNLIVDSSIYGMGRGAGNLNTELFVEYLNENYGKDYRLKPILTIIDEIINAFYQQNYWGYSLPNYISASHNAHPNYASYLNDKNTLTYEDMNNIFDMMDDEKRVSYDKAYIEDLYLQYMALGNENEAHKAELYKCISGKTVVLIAPGKSSTDERDLILGYPNKGVVYISVNFSYPECNTDFIFVSNLRRFNELAETYKSNCIVTSNISDNNVYYKTKYGDLLNAEEAVADNAGLMAIRFLINFGAKRIMLAGFDGYSFDARENYGNSDMAFVTKRNLLEAMNLGMTKVLTDYRKMIDIQFLTTPKHVLFRS